MPTPRRLNTQDHLALQALVELIRDARDGDAERAHLEQLRVTSARLLDLTAPGNDASAPSRRQLDVLRVIVRHSRAGVAPTYREIGEALGLPNVNAVHAHVQALLRKRLLALREKGTARNLSATPAGRRAVVEAEQAGWRVA